MTDEYEVYAYSILARSRGGQQAGIEPGVIVIHRPSGLAVLEQNERSQFKNKELAMIRLRGVLEDLGVWL